MKLRLLVVGVGLIFYAASCRSWQPAELEPVHGPGCYIDGELVPGHWVPGPPDPSGGDRPTFVRE